MFIRRTDYDNAKVVGELYGVAFRDIGDLIGMRMESRRNGGILPVGGAIIGYNAEHRLWLVQLDLPYRGSSYFSVSAHLL